MANNSQSHCTPPFLNLNDFPYKGGLESGRFCAPVTQNVSCCLPCPITDWVYKDNYLTVANAANWVALGSVICCCSLLLSFVALPVQKTSRHYLTICLVSAVGLCCLSFVIALAADPEECHDAITPNDMSSDTACGFSGALVLFGGSASVMWIFLRSLSLYLQICWQIVPGRKFFLAALVGGWGIPALILGLSLGLSGVSYRFGNICHINHVNSLGTFWGPLLAFSGLAGALQFITLIYCIRVYLRSVMDSGSNSATSSNLQSFQGSIKTVSARAAYRRVRKVISLQWRGICVVLILLISVIYFAVVFIKLDAMTADELRDPEDALPWLGCIVLNGGDKSKCLDQASELILNESAVMAVLFLIATFGFWCALFLGRVSMIIGWIELLRRPFSRSREFISIDTRRTSDPTNYEMLNSPPQKYHIHKTAEGLVAVATSDTPDLPIVRDFSPPPPEFNKAPRAERSPSLNFSHPRPLERTASQNNRVTFSREGPSASPIRKLAMPLEEEESRTISSTNYSQPASPRNQQRTTYERQSQQRADSTSSRQRERTSSALGREWSAVHSTSSARSSPLPHRTNSALSSRDWDPSSTFARSNRMGSLSPERP